MPQALHSRLGKPQVQVLGPRLGKAEFILSARLRAVEGRE